MAEIKIINEEPLTISEIKEKLELVKKRDKELNPRAQKTYDYLRTFSKLNQKKVKEIRDKVMKLNIPRLKDRHVVKLIDIEPKDLDSMKIIFSGENITIKQEDLEKLLKVIKENV